MGKRNAPRTFLMGASAAAGLMMLASCNDFLTGQDGEPRGSLKVTKLTLNDPGRGVVTDTSVPADCSVEAVKDTPQCTSDPFMDTYGVLKSPPNPDSARMLRVVFNKAPMNLMGMPLEPVPDEGLPSPEKPLKLADPSVISLTCQNCSTDSSGNMGVPATYNSLQLTGTDLSPDPSQYAYGPGLQMEVLATCPKATMLPAAPTKCQLAGPTYVSDPFRALEPGATYSVVLKPTLQGRLADGTDNVLLDDQAKALLTFTTEPFKPLVVGIGDAEHGGAGGTDNTVDGSSDHGVGSAAMPYLVDGEMPQVANDGAITLLLNAPADESAFTMMTATATVTVGGAPMSVPVVLSTAVGAAGKCDYGDRRLLYIAPTSGTWLVAGMAGAVVDITLRGSEVRDLSQLPGHPAGKGIHALSQDIHIRATLLAAAADMDYTGVLAADVVSPPDC